MALALLGMNAAFTGWLASAGWRIPGLAILVLGGAAIYGLCVLGTGAMRLADFKSAVRRSP